MGYGPNAKGAFGGEPGYAITAKAVHDRKRRTFRAEARGAAVHILTGGFLGCYAIWKEGI